MKLEWEKTMDIYKVILFDLPSRHLFEPSKGVAKTTQARCWSRYCDMRKNSAQRVLVLANKALS